MLIVLAVFSIPAVVFGLDCGGWGLYKGHCYALRRHGLANISITYAESEAVCVNSFGSKGHLTPVQDQAELNFLASISSHNDSKYYEWYEQPLLGIKKVNGLNWEYPFNDMLQTHAKWCTDFKPSLKGRECAILMVDNVKSKVDPQYDRKKTQPCLVPVPCDHKFKTLICRYKLY